MAQSSFNSFPSNRPDKKGGGSNIKSIQRGISTLVSLNKDIAITAVNRTKSILTVSPRGADVTTIADLSLRGYFTADDNVHFITQGTYNQDFAWEVIEFNNVKSLQRGTFNTSGGNVTISPVNISKTMIFNSWSSSSTQTGHGNVEVYLQDATTLAVLIGVTSINLEWQVIEFN